MIPNFDQISLFFGVLISLFYIDHDVFFFFAHCHSAHDTQIHGVCIFQFDASRAQPFAWPARCLVFWPPTLALGSTVRTW